MLEMKNNQQKEADLRDELIAELAKLLCADDISEEQKLSRIKAAQQILNDQDKEDVPYASTSRI